MREPGIQGRVARLLDQVYARSRRAGMMATLPMIKIEKRGSLYAAHATPPHVREEWISVQPLPMRALVDESRSRGAHQTDIGDALYEVDPNWISI